jgi:rhodanese-related sulfurtransferase
VLATPGHTPESISLLVIDEEKGAQAWAVFTRDTLFIGDVGRPDLSPQHTPTELAESLYDSLHNKLMTLPGPVLVYPVHGAGSLCGRNMRAERFSTISIERLTNYALQISDREEFVRQVTSNLPARPDYFLEDAAINRAGAPALAELPELKPVAAEELKEMLDQGAMVLDVRPGEEFVAAHVPGSACIPLSGQSASWAGAVLVLSAKSVLVAETPEQVSEARARLACIGVEDVVGYLKGGVDGWRKAGLPMAQVTQITARELASRRSSGGIGVLDVRREAEFQSGHTAGADWHPLDRFKAALPDISKDKPVAVHSKGGYRSPIAVSLLQSAGYHNVVWPEGSTRGPGAGGRSRPRKRSERSELCSRLPKAETNAGVKYYSTNQFHKAPPEMLTQLVYSGAGGGA